MMQRMKAALDHEPILNLRPYPQDVATNYSSLDASKPEKVFGLAWVPDLGLLVAAGGGLAVIDPETGARADVHTGPVGSAPIRWLRALSDGVVYAGTLQNVCRLHGPPAFRLDTVLDIPAVDALFDAAGNPMFLTAAGVVDHRGNLASSLPAGLLPTSFAMGWGGVALIATDHGLFRATVGEATPVRATSSDRCPEDADLRAVLVDRCGGAWLAARSGLRYVTDNACLEFAGADGLPITDLRCLAGGADGGLWLGGRQGVVRYANGCWRYYAGRRWLPDDEVLDLAPDSDGGVWVATATGVVRIHFPLMTLSAKSQHYESITLARHSRDGFIAECHLDPPGDLSCSCFEATDNDGLWTALYVAAESFRFAVTADTAARDLATKSLRRLLDLVRLTGIPGFPARAIIRDGERVIQSDPGANWHPSPVDPSVIYKNDTSSDEIDGHYFAWFIYSDLVADDREREEIAAVCRAVTNHILDHGYTLVGPTGRHTRWGVWSPEHLNSDPRWAAERGLNSLEILSHLKVAIHLCGDQRFRDAYEDLIIHHHYALNTVRQKLLPPEGENNHSDDELSAVAYYPLLLLETDPTLRGFYLASIERTQRILDPERSPFYNVLYGACTGRPCGAESAAQWLRDAPLDLRDWTMTNSGRADVSLEPDPGRHGERQLTRVLPANETRAAKWNRNPYVADAGCAGAREEDGTFWLLPYWMGRFHGVFGPDEG